MEISRRSVAVMLLLGAGLASFGAWQFGGVSLLEGGERHEHEAGGEEAEVGETELPPAFLSRLEGRILEVEREREGGRRLFEVKIEEASGRIRELLVDAESGAIVAVER